MKALIFGANGQDGFYLTQILLENKIDVTAISRSGGNEIIKGDVADLNFVQEIIKREQPKYIFHLAANSTTQHNVLFENHSTISTGTLNILETVKIFSPQSKIFLSGSALQFKNTGQPIKESDPFEARDAYAVSRIQSVYAARYYRTLGLKVYVGYFFNHESPRRTERHVSKMIGEAVKKINNGHKEIIEIGDISVKKEWTFAGDIMKAILLLVKQDKIFEAIIGSGQGYTIEEYLIECFGLIKKDWKKYVRIKNDFIPQYKSLVGDPSAILALGWKPEKTFNDLVKMMLTS